jgi:uncharacterized membrane protein SpoIIM required for sporulation
MTSLEFEARHEGEWRVLEAQLAELEAGRGARIDAEAALRGYRRVCEQLAVARARAYPLHLAERLDGLAQRAYRLVYRPAPRAWQRLRELVLQRFPRLVRRRWPYQLAALLVFVVPMLAVGIAVRLDPAFALTVLEASQLAQFDDMYGDQADAIGRTRGAETDWQMFGFYIRNNISVAFQCFATGLLAGLGSLFFTAYNGVLMGAVAGFLDGRGLGHNFWPFVATHGAFELTAIVIASGGGLQLGHAVLMPGRLTRAAALRAAARDGALLIAGAAVMLVVAAFVEAFWSSATWVPPASKFGAAAACWAAVALYLARAGRDAR